MHVCRHDFNNGASICVISLTCESISALEMTFEVAGNKHGTQSNRPSSKSLLSIDRTDGGFFSLVFSVLYRAHARLLNNKSMCVSARFTESPSFMRS